LAPIAVLAPTLGDGGRAIFTGWATRLLGAVTSRLLFSFLLGALLSMQRIIASLAVLGWWTQWLLFSAMWWMAFLRRHQAAAILREGSAARHRGAGHAAHPAPGRGVGSRMARLAHPHPVRGVEQALHAYGAIRHPARWIEAQTNARIAHRPPGEERHGKSASKQSAKPPVGARVSPKSREEAVALAPELEAPVLLDGQSPAVPRGRSAPPKPAGSSAPRAPSVHPGRPASPESPVPPDPSAGRQGAAHPSRAERDSAVMKDAFAVQRGEKPKLGFDFKDPEP
jgi:hypothetical protein